MYIPIQRWEYINIHYDILTVFHLFRLCFLYFLSVSFMYVRYIHYRSKV